MLSVHSAELIEQVAQSTLKQFSSVSLKPEQLAISLRILQDGTTDSADYRGNEPIYPASVIKLFYLVAAHKWLEDKRIDETEELKRAMTDMIVDSSNDATHYVIDLLTGTTSGPELPPAAMEEWMSKRKLIDHYFKSLGYEN